MSPERSEGVFDARGRADDRARAWDMPLYAGPMTKRTNGLVPEQGGGTKPTEVFQVIPKEKIYCLKLTDNPSIIGSLRQINQGKDPWSYWRKL